MRLALCLGLAAAIVAGLPVSRRRSAPPPGPSDQAYRETPLTVHGLWPNRAGVGVRRQPQDCATARPPPPPASLRANLMHVTPGVADGLDRYEWRRHGSCSGLSPEAYFSAVVAATLEANATIGAAIKQHGWFGKQVGVRELLDAVAQTNSALANAVIVGCKMARKGSGQFGAFGCVYTPLTPESKNPWVR